MSRSMQTVITQNEIRLFFFQAMFYWICTISCAFLNKKNLTLYHSVIGNYECILKWSTGMQILNQSKVHIPEFSVSSDICLPLQSKQAFLFPKLMLPHLQCTIKETLLFMKIIHVKENTKRNSKQYITMQYIHHWL